MGKEVPMHNFVTPSSISLCYYTRDVPLYKRICMARLCNLRFQIPCKKFDQSAFSVGDISLFNSRSNKTVLYLNAVE